VKTQVPVKEVNSAENSKERERLTGLSPSDVTLTLCPSMVPVPVKVVPSRESENVTEDSV